MDGFLEDSGESGVYGSYIACPRLPDSRENESNCVWKASGGLSQGEAGEPESISLRLMLTFWGALGKIFRKRVILGKTPANYISPKR